METTTMYEHDIKATEQFARENPAVMAGALEKISFKIEVIRYRCPRCGQHGSINKDSFTGRNVMEHGRLICGPCDVDMYLRGLE